MDSAIKVSVIMPMYNAEKYLQQTLRDVTGQTLREIEILCVDDGSSDGTPRIAEACAAKDDRVRLIRQQHLTAGAARNRGLSEARGRCVVFWDADDRFEPDALEKLYRQMEKTGADISVCMASRLDDATNDRIETGVYLKEEYLRGADVYSRDTHPSYLFNITTNVPWNKMFRRSFVLEHGLQFENRPRANDVYFCMLAVYHASKIAVVRERLVTYRINSSESLTGTLYETPHNSFDAFCAVKRQLEADGIQANPALVQSFANRALQGMLYCLHKCARGDAFLAWFEFLKSEGFEKLGIRDGKDYYYIEETYRRYRGVMESTPLDYALAYGREEMQKQQGEIKRLKERVRTLEGRLRESGGAGAKCAMALESAAARARKKLKKYWYRFSGKR